MLNYSEGGRCGHVLQRFATRLHSQDGISLLCCRFNSRNYLGNLVFDLYCVSRCKLHYSIVHYTEVGF